MANRNKYWKNWGREWNARNPGKHLRQLTDKQIKNEIKTEVTDWQSGVWQYLADHTTPHRKGYVIRFIVAHEEDFWWRVEQRKKGSYVRNDVEAVAKKVESIVHGHHHHANIDRSLTRLNKMGPWYVKVFLRFRKFINRQARKLGERYSHELEEWYEPITNDSYEVTGEQGENKKGPTVEEKGHRTGDQNHW